MTGIVKTDQIQGAQGTTVTVPTGHTLAVTDNATVGGTLGVTGDITATNTGGNRTLGIITGTSNSSILNMGDTDASNVGQVKYHHGVNSMVLRTNGSDKVTLDATGNLLFNAASTGVYLGTTSATASNLLDDYEEGSWTPVFVGSSGGSATYSHQVGRYTKIGNRVCANCYLALSGNSLSGTVSMSGLPYAGASISQLYHSVSIWINTMTNGTDFDGDFFLEGFLDHNGSTSIFLYSLDGDGGVVSMMAGDLSGLTDIMINFTYQTN
tara:strand:- start:32 stop:832 length:801 start_codon:yes stop_codon:yes gene_type:complete